MSDEIQPTFSGDGDDLWLLPQVRDISVELVRYREPRTYYVGIELRQALGGAEFLVRTAAPLPIRALSPALFVGEVPVLRYTTLGLLVYRFVGFDLTRYRPGAPLSLGWPDYPESRVETPFRYTIGGSTVA